MTRAASKEKDYSFKKTRQIQLYELAYIMKTVHSTESTVQITNLPQLNFSDF